MNTSPQQPIRNLHEFQEYRGYKLSPTWFGLLWYGVTDDYDGPEDNKNLLYAANVSDLCDLIDETLNEQLIEA